MTNSLLKYSLTLINSFGICERTPNDKFYYVVPKWENGFSIFLPLVLEMLYRRIIWAPKMFMSVSKWSI